MFSQFLPWKFLSCLKIRNALQKNANQILQKKGCLLEEINAEMNCFMALFTDELCAIFCHISLDVFHFLNNVLHGDWKRIEIEKCRLSHQEKSCTHRGRVATQACVPWRHTDPISDFWIVRMTQHN